MTQSATRRLWLLGLAHVDQIQKAHSEAQENAAGVGPRFRSRRTAGLLGYLAAERRPIGREHLAALFWPDETPSKGRANLSRELYNLAQILPDCWRLDRQSRRHAEAILMRVIEGHSQRGRYADALRYTRRLLQLTPWNEEIHMRAMRLLAWTGQRGAALRQFEICKTALLVELDVQPTEETAILFQQIQAGKLDLPPQLPAFLTDEKARHKFEQPLFVGRESELALLDTFMNAALTGQGQVIFVTGGPGRGKTVLLEAFTQRAMASNPNLLVASSKCNAYAGVGDPYLPYRDMMAMLAGDVEGRWDAGTITRDHARRLWSAFPLVVQVLLDHGPHLLDVLVPGEALLSRSEVAGQEYIPYLSRLREHVKRDWMTSKELEQSNLFQQFVNVLKIIAREKPLLVILDDIQWADAASISLLFHLGRHLADVDSRLLITCAYRPEEIALGRAGIRHPLAKVLSEFKRTFGDAWLDLGRTRESEARQFIDALLDAEPNKLPDGFRSALCGRTGGHPLFTVELLRAMKDRGALVKDAEGMWIVGPDLEWHMLPVQVEAVIEERINKLDPVLQDILTIASVEGELFTANVVAEVRNVTEKSALSRLSQDLERRHRLVIEQEEVEIGQRRLSRYRFAHVLFQDYIYRRLGQGERRLLHGEVAAVLEELYEGQLDEMAVHLAHHYHQAGDHSQAFHYYSLAAERAARLHESGEAITHYTHAIRIAERISPDVTSLARLHSGRGRSYERLGDFEQARSDHTITLQLADLYGEQQVAWRAELDLGRLWASRDYEHARNHFESALELARRLNDEAVLARSLNWTGNWHANAENPQNAVEFHQEALSIFEDLGDRRELANTLDLLGMANMLGGDLSTSIQTHDRAITLFRELDDRPGLGSSLLGRANNASMLVFLASIPGNPAHIAISDFEEALQIAREIGSLADEAWAHWSLGLLHTILGQVGQALTLMQSGLQIATNLGHREWLLCNRFSLGILYAELYAPERAREHLEAALTLVSELRSPHYTHLVKGAFAGACFVTNDLKSAQACLDEVISTKTPMNTIGKRYCWTRRAELALLQDDPALALDVVERLISSAPGMLPGRVITYLWKLKGEALATMGHTENACSLLNRALENAHGSGERFLLWRIHASLGRLYRTMGHQESAEKEFAVALALIDELAATVADETLKEVFRQGAYNIL
jgi:tetratricopeptide (TPR) repeat protein